LKICVKSDNAGWIIDNISKDYKKYSKHSIVREEHADLAWHINLFGFNTVCKKNIVYIHHINELKLNLYNFKLYNTADACIVPSLKTKCVVEKYLNIPIYHFPQWIVSSSILAPDDEKVKKLKQKIGDKYFLIGSFVKDGDGKSGKNPKLVKDPDKFISIVKAVNNIMPVKVVLAGYARQYVISRLQKEKIPFECLQRYPNISDLYNLIDCYLVTSKVEGGPQSVYEASYWKKRIFSTDVGVASEVLHPTCICDSVHDFVKRITSDEYDLEYNYKNVINNHTYQTVIPKLDSFFEEFMEK